MKDWLTTAEGAAFLGVTRGRVLQMISDGTLKTERFGRVHMINREALKEAKSRRTKPGPVPKKASKKGGKK